MTTSFNPAYDYNRTRHLGNIGEKIFMAHFTEYDACLVDEQTDLHTQYAGIDHVIEILWDSDLENFIGKSVYTTDVKYDQKSDDTNRVVYELESSKNNVGWLFKLEVNTFTHVLPSRKKMIIVKAPEVRTFYKENPNLFYHPAGHIGPTATGNAKKTIIACLPVDILEEQDFSHTINLGD